ALTMIDTGSTGNFIGPAFAMVTRLRTFPLEQQLTLQLGCMGSHSHITHGAHAQLSIGAFSAQIYFDIANIDRYDCILGIPFLWQNAAVIDFGQQILRIGWGEIPMLQDAEATSTRPAHVQALRIRVIKPMTEEDIPRLQNQWFQEYKDILSGIIPRLPPLREVNHRIPLIDKGKQYSYHLPRCPDTLKQQLLDKIRLYTDAGWWEMKSVPQATPMLCILKKTG
ncbi:hypothetical protein SCLCIDRAFT_85679, partial [Scleroderma citrinum Foug A]